MAARFARAREILKDIPTARFYFWVGALGYMGSAYRAERKIRKTAGADATWDDAVRARHAYYAEHGTDMAVAAMTWPSTLCRELAVAMHAYKQPYAPRRVVESA